MILLFINAVILIFSININATLTVEADTLFFSSQDNEVDFLLSLSDEKKGEYFLKAVHSFKKEIFDLDSGDERLALSRKVSFNPRINYLELLLSALKIPDSVDALKFVSHLSEHYCFRQVDSVSLLDLINSHAHSELLKDESKTNHIIEKIIDTLQTKHIGKDGKLSDFEKKVFGVFLGIIGRTAFGRNQLALLLRDEQILGVFLRFFEEKFAGLKSSFTDSSLIFTNFMLASDNKNYIKLLNDNAKSTHINEFCDGILYNNDVFISEQSTPEETNIVSWKKGLLIDIDGVKTGYNIHFPKFLNQASRLIVLVWRTGMHNKIGRLSSRRSE